MENKRFRRRCENARRRKLEVLLSRLTGNRLSAEQCAQIIRQLDLQKQYRVQVWLPSESAHPPPLPAECTVRILLDGGQGSVQPTAAAYLLTDCKNKITADTLYICLPYEEDTGDASR